MKLANALLALSCALLLITPVYAEKVINKPAVLKAIAEYNDTIAKDSNAQSAYVDRAFLNYLLGNIKEAITDYDKLISIDNNNEEYYLNRGYLKHISNDRAGALEDYNAALKINPRYAYAHNNRGVVLSELGRNNDSLEAYNTAIKINPEYADAYYNRGNLMTKTDNNEEALADYSSAIKYNPHDSASYNNRGVVKRKLNFDVGALSDFSIAIKINPEDITALSNRGHLKKRYYDSEGAEEDFNNAIASANESPNIVKQIETEKLISESELATASIQKQTTAEMHQAKVASENIHKISSKVLPQKQESTTKTAAIKANIVKVDPKSSRVSEVPASKQSATPSITTKPVENPQLAECYYIRALQKYILQKREDALNDFDMAIKYNPNYAEAYYYRAAVKRDFKDEDFVNDYKKAISLKPSLKSMNESDVLTILKI